jgi:hypothetical protein
VDEIRHRGPCFQSLSQASAGDVSRFEHVEDIRRAAEKVVLHWRKTGTHYRSSSAQGPNFDAPVAIFGPSKEKQASPTVK